MGILCKFFYDDGKVFPPDPKVPLDDAGRFFGRCHIRKEADLLGQPPRLIINIEVLQRSI